MKKRLSAALVAIPLFVASPALASEVPECPPGTIHIVPLCLTEAEWQVYWSPPPTSVAPSPFYGPQESLVRQLAYYYWPGWAAERMIRIAKCESGYSPTAQHPRSGAAGLWQIMPFWQRTWPGDYFDPWTNAAVAYQIWLVQGFGAWVCRG